MKLQYDTNGNPYMEWLHNPQDGTTKRVWYKPRTEQDWTGRGGFIYVGNWRDGAPRGIPQDFPIWQTEEEMAITHAVIAIAHTLRGLTSAPEVMKREEAA